MVILTLGDFFGRIISYIGGNMKKMKWPRKLYLVRHGQTTYNILKAKKAVSPLYQEFKGLFEEWTGWPNDPSPKLVELALLVRQEFYLGCSDRNTPLTQLGIEQSEQTGRALADIIEVPDVVFHSSSIRTNQTFNAFARFCPQFNDVKVVEDDRLREQSHGLSTLYSDWRVFHVFNPQQRALFIQEGSYDYRFPNGEDKPMVRDRNRSWQDKLIREYGGKIVWAFSHHLTILSIMGLQLNWTADQFIEKDEKEPPPNSSVTMFECNPFAGDNGKLILKQYGQVYY